MINNYKCDYCTISEICQAKAKLKPFSEEAKKDLGVILDFIDCNNFNAEDVPQKDEE